MPKRVIGGSGFPTYFQLRVRLSAGLASRQSQSSGHWREQVPKRVIGGSGFPTCYVLCRFSGRTASAGAKAVPFNRMLHREVLPRDVVPLHSVVWCIRCTLYAQLGLVPLHQSDRGPEKVSVCTIIIGKTGQAHYAGRYRLVAFALTWCYRQPVPSACSDLGAL